MKRSVKISAIVLTVITVTRGISLEPLAKYMGTGHEFWSFEPVKLTAYCLAAAVVFWALVIGAMARVRS